MSIVIAGKPTKRQKILNGLANKQRKQKKVTLYAQIKRATYHLPATLSKGGKEKPSPRKAKRGKGKASSAPLNNSDALLPSSANTNYGNDSTAPPKKSKKKSGTTKPRPTDPKEDDLTSQLAAYSINAEVVRKEDLIADIQNVNVDDLIDDYLAAMIKEEKEGPIAENNARRRKRQEQTLSQLQDELLAKTNAKRVYNRIIYVLVTVTNLWFNDFKHVDVYKEKRKAMKAFGSC
ncbi:hypothetical protein K504DRAFT_493301 [Pleomassaria siparia CBS 279.74]|uniref:Uncharacterized protein n=1 Tax=Pleomassaria siparia CBS 279.74 TaxID=1314801 RepID=A0A6G1JZR8_9PLEO|nr:hypothetical protein K504DRAFT_493301 [Pleomassaria siparia CBS 279.74]